MSEDKDRSEVLVTQQPMPQIVIRVDGEQLKY